MRETNWYQREIPLSPKPSPTPAAPHAPVVSPARPDTTPLAGRGDRLGAAIIDAVLCLVMIAAAVAVAAALGLDFQATPVRIGLASGVLPLAVLQMVLLSLRGQTLGKALMGVRVVDQEDGRNPGFVRVVLLRQFLPGVITALPYLGKVFWLIDCLCIFGEERRCLHDVIAGTKVVRTE
jgi:uncharacterized RDD family membrane protein YckC